MIQFGEFLKKPKACGQTELPDKSVLIGQKLVENAKIQKIKCYILGDFQTLYGMVTHQKDKARFVYKIERQGQICKQNRKARPN